MILVTFSFAIAGFLIDLMWVSIYVIINLMAQADPSIAASAVTVGIYHPAPQFANDILNTSTGISRGESIVLPLTAQPQLKISFNNLSGPIRSGMPLHLMAAGVASI